MSDTGVFTKSEQALVDYFNSGADLAEHVKSLIKKDRIIDDKCVIILNEFIIAAHKIADLQFELERRSYKLN